MASGIEIAKELRALEAHYSFKVVRSGEEQERFMRDFVADLRDFSLEDIQAGCRAWRTSLAKQFPTSGQLIASIKQNQRSPTDRRASEPWRELTEAEYAGLSLRDKIRHHLILAHQAKGRAGPMWKDGRPAEPEELPPQRRIWLDKADFHHAEARRLQEHISVEDRRA